MSGLSELRCLCKQISVFFLPILVAPFVGRGFWGSSSALASPFADFIPLVWGHGLGWSVCYHYRDSLTCLFAGTLAGASCSTDPAAALDSRVLLTVFDEPMCVACMLELFIFVFSV